MALLQGINAIQQQSASDNPHALGFAVARTVADDGLFEVWNGETGSATVFRLNKDGQTQLQDGSAGAPAVAPEGDKDTGIYFVSGTPEVAAAIAGTKVLSVVAAGVDVTGALSMTGQLTSTLSPGTPPLVVASTTLVDNLNADQLDGLEGSSYALVSHTHAATDINSGILPVARLSGAYTGITGVGTLASGTWQGAQIADVYLAALAATKLTGTVASARLAGSYTGITGLGVVTAGTWQGTQIADAYLADLAASKLTGTALPAGIVTSSLTSLGTLSGLALSGGTADVSRATSGLAYMRVKTADVAHGLSAFNNVWTNDTVLAITNTQAGGAAGIDFLAEAAGAARPGNLRAYGGSHASTKTSAANSRGAFSLEVYGHDDAGNMANVGADANMFTLAGQVGGTLRTLFIIDEDGDYHYDGADGSAFDEYDDAQLVRAFALATSPRDVIRTEFDDFVRYNEDDLVRTGILGAPVKEGGLVNGAQLQRLHTGAIWQQATRQQQLESALRAVLDSNPALAGADQARALLGDS